LEPKNRHDSFAIFDGYHGKVRRLLWILFAATCWLLWTTRNKFTIEAKFSRQPADCIFKILINLQLWRPLLKPKDAVLLDVLVLMLKRLFSGTLPPQTAIPST
jgi:hypothetical protein